MNELTDRQKEIMGLVAQGKSNQQIAAILNLSVQTVKNMVTTSYRKMEVDNRVSAALKFLGVGQ